MAKRLRECGILAQTLSAAQFDAMTELLLEHMPADTVRERWSTMRFDNVYATTCVVNPEKLAGTGIDTLWRWPADRTVVTIKLADTADGVQAGALVRYVSDRRIRRKQVRRWMPGALWWTPGIQRRLLQAALLGSDFGFAAEIATIKLADLGPLHIPIGPAGQMIGRAGETAVAISLWNDNEHPRRLRIDARVHLALAHQLVLRAVATGAVVSVHTDDRARWQSLITAVDDPDRLFLAAAGAKYSGIAVFDRKPVSAVAARSVMVLSLPHDGPPGDGVDVTLVQKQKSMQIITGDVNPITVLVDLDEDLRVDPVARGAGEAALGGEPRTADTGVSGFHAGSSHHGQASPIELGGGLSRLDVSRAQRRGSSGKLDVVAKDRRTAGSRSRPAAYQPRHGKETRPTELDS
ncbi:hypothetical protein MmonteBS_49570 [Mycobacterium montefiorense]|uniref:Type VII secretion system protein EccE domain-containing protein n=1 Tax=Mycobacterium montefiorense TaxID=154654 RepID=A0AA37UXZ3_9MYCO|nr:hypothetical protein MmonteBS_49570 [Mycobacterium montefiorense]GKU39245.1 hypothetical protein NJB14192_12400 [Mycobacterium montefiorense]GKU44766.1 hypothetical protein NJB14194_13920 [Mycobacterium montefiorense]GKU61971.1 hypothetical protein NJB18182_24730 [Mycobacterium montefiorense]GKU69395.1 hypothetical protein NJB18183_45400 [Mycobacterium montefiorense]